MVPTRGVKVKFYEGERVLCYEPDPTKAKVLYDSKVLDIVVNKDHRGRKTIEYLIHFQGWNSSWDRCVGEEYVLKDTPENRQLQKDLAEKSQLQFGTYLYRKERKKHNRKTGDRVTSEEDNNSSSPGRMDTDDGQEQESSTSEDDSSVEDDVIPLELPAGLREILEQDYYLINNKRKLLKLPAEPNVITILENYWKHYVTNQYCGANEKNNGKYRFYFTQPKNKSEDIQKNLNICKEVLDGLRIYFDYTVNDLLLYKYEQGQIATKPPIDNLKTDSAFKTENNHSEYSNNLQNIIENNNHSDQEEKKKNTRRRTLRSGTNMESQQLNGNNIHSDGPSGNSVNIKLSSSGISDSSNPMMRMLSWKLLPSYVYTQQLPAPCVVYGATHLLRLFVKLPELLGASPIADDKLKMLLRHLESFMDFMNEHKEWYGEKFYIDTDQ